MRDEAGPQDYGTTGPRDYLLGWSRLARRRLAEGGWSVVTGPWSACRAGAARRRVILGLASALCASLLALCPLARAELTLNYGFTTNASIPDGTGQYTNTRTLGGLASYSNVTVNPNLTTPDINNPMYLGDMYSTLTIGTAQESNRVAVLLNRPGRDNTNQFGSSLSSLNVTLTDSAANNVWGTTSSTGTYRPDARINVNPYGPAVPFVDNGTATLSALNGASLPSNKFTLLMADTSGGGQAQLTNWGMTVTGTAAASGTMSADGGTFSITDDGGTNNLGAAVVTTQAGGGALNVTATGGLTFSGGVSGTSALNKLGSGTLTLSAAGTYTGGTTVNAGTLLVNNTSGSGTGTGSVTVSNNGTVLGGTGTISGAVTINSGAAILGGTAATASGALTVAGSLTLNSNSIIELALGASGAHSTLARSGSGTWSFQATQHFNFIDLGAQPTTYNNIITGLASDPGTEANWVINNPGWTGTFTFDGVNIDLTLSQVPEPATWVAGALAVIALFATQRRRLARIMEAEKRSRNFPDKL
jgi:autotransporter-associated beta strand protein